MSSYNSHHNESVYLKNVSLKRVLLNHKCMPKYTIRYRYRYCDLICQLFKRHFYYNNHLVLILKSTLYNINI